MSNNTFKKAGIINEYQTYGPGESPAGYNYYRSGYLAAKPSIFGEYGAEWAVPTYEPKRSQFLRDVGVDTKEIGR